MRPEAAVRVGFVPHHQIATAVVFRIVMSVLPESSEIRAIAARILVLVTVILFPACSAKESGDAGEAAPPGPMLSDLFRIGDESAGDTILFGRIADLLAVDRTGRIFVGDEHASRLYAFAADGSHIQAIGQRGRGPGEFEWIESIYAGPGDTLYVFDSELDRISIYEPNGLTLAYDLAVPRDSRGQPAWLVGVRNTDILITYEQPLGPADADRERRSYVMRLNRKGQLLPLPVHDLPGSGIVAGRFAIHALPFIPSPVYRLGPGNVLYAGWTDSVNIAIREPKGTPGRDISYSLELIPLTRSEIRMFVEGTSDMFREAMLGADLPATKPAYQTFVVDDQARIWLKLTTQSIADTTARWIILDAESRLRGQVNLQVNTMLHVVREDRAYAVTQGAEATVIVYELRE